MNLLVVAASFPYPPTSGGRIRLWEELRFLGRRHSVTAVCFGHADAAPGPSPLGDVCLRIVAVPHPRRLAAEDLALSRGLPWPLRWYGTAGMDRALRDIRPWAFDAVIVDSLYMTLYRDVVGARAILQEHNVESQLAQQFVEWKAGAPPDHTPRRRLWRAVAMQLEAYENRIWPEFPLRVAVCGADKAAIDQRCPVGRTIVLENGADVSAPVVRDHPGPRTLLFMGALDYVPNIDAAFHLIRKIMPAVWARAFDVRLIVAGRDPDPRLTALARDPRVQVIANPQDMRTVAAQTSVSIVPLRLGGGTRLKILESLAWGLPVVTTGVGCAGLALVDGEHLIVRDDPAAIAEAVLRLLSDAAWWRRLSAAGRAAVEQRYGWESLLVPFEAELHRFVHSATAASGPPRPPQ